MQRDPRPILSFVVIILGCCVNSVDKDGLTPLHQAIIHGNRDAAELLLCYNAKVFASSGVERTRSVLEFSSHVHVCHQVIQHSVGKRTVFSIHRHQTFTEVCCTFQGGCGLSSTCAELLLEGSLVSDAGEDWRSFLFRAFCWPIWLPSPLPRATNFTPTGKGWECNTVNPKILCQNFFCVQNFSVRNFRVKIFLGASACPKIKKTDNFLTGEKITNISNHVKDRGRTAKGVVHSRTPYIQRASKREAHLYKEPRNVVDQNWSCHHERRSCCWTFAMKGIQTVFALLWQGGIPPENFRIFIFQIFGGTWKYFYTENFQIYGTCCHAVLFEFES